MTLVERLYVWNIAKGMMITLGHLFKKKATKIEKRERLFLIRSNVVSKSSVLPAQGVAPVTVTPIAGQEGDAVKPVAVQSEMGLAPSPVVASIRASSLNGPLNAQRAALPTDVRVADPAVQQVRDRQAQLILRDELQRSKGQLSELRQNLGSDAAPTPRRQGEIQRAEADVQALERELARLEKR